MFKKCLKKHIDDDLLDQNCCMKNSNIARINPVRLMLKDLNFSNQGDVVAICGKMSK